MKYIKFFESKNPQLDEELNEFLKEYEIHKKRGDGRYYKNSIILARNYKVPDILHEEFALLDYLYGEHTGGWKWNKSKEICNYIKKEVKKLAVKSIVQKFDENVDNYDELKKMLEKRPRFNDTGSFDNIGIASVKYIFYLLHDAIKKAPDWIKDATKYNL